MALLLVSSLLAAGCSGRHASDAGPVTVRVAYFPNITHAAALVASARGSFAEALGPAVRVEEQTFGAGPAEIEALFANQVDIGYMGPGPAVNGFLRSQGEALRIVAGASSGGAALVVRRDARIVDLKGLAGKRVAVPQIGGTQDISLRHALQGVRLTSTDKGGSVSVLSVANPDTLPLFAKGQLDAAWVPEPWVSRLVKEAGGAVLQDERDLWPGRKFATTVVVVRTEFLKRHPDLVRRFLAAHMQTVDWIHTHPDAARKTVGDRLAALTHKTIPDDILRMSLSRTDITYDPERQTVLTFADWSRALGYLRDDRQSLAGLFDLSLLNRVLAEQARPPLS